MIFDMMRPLGAKRGELEVNTLGTLPLSGNGQQMHWAPEVEYAFADGWAVEFELPFEGRRLAELKVGLQASFGSSNDGRLVHGIQYFGVYDRAHRSYRSTVAYMIGHRFNDRWSMMSMVGLADVSARRASGRNGAIINHSTFFDLSDHSVAGLEINYLGGREGHILVMPQWHQRLSSMTNVQLGIGIEKGRHDAVRPKAGARLIREF